MARGHVELSDFIGGAGRKSTTEANGGKSMSEYQKDSYQAPETGSSFPDSKPLEPEGSKPGRTALLKWFIILVFIIYVLFSYLHVPILAGIGRYLILSHPPQKSDLIVCLAGQKVETGLAAADALSRGLGPRIFVAREEPPDGYEVLKQRGVPYPESIDLMGMILTGLGVPEPAIIVGEKPVKSAWEEAELVGDLVKKKNYRSILLITSPTQSRRAYLTFRSVIQEKDCPVLVMPSPYSNFKPENWWHHGKYTKEVLLEYQKLLHLAVKELF
jgi:uncharacterized SAM-binding protein YcdF (DUF218 family)